jgi:hypothetical protein
MKSAQTKSRWRALRGQCCEFPEVLVGADAGAGGKRDACCERFEYGGGGISSQTGTGKRIAQALKSPYSKVWVDQQRDKYEQVGTNKNGVNKHNSMEQD